MNVKRAQVPLAITGFIAALLAPTTAHAYVDPGVLGLLYQGLYVLLFGAVTAFILRPWNYLKSLFGKGSNRSDDTDGGSAPSGTAKDRGDSPDGDHRS